jgi:hypothetical protein
MSQRDDRYARNDLPSTTAEFRATPDASASTAQFKAFAAGQDVQDQQRGTAPSAWPEQPWAGGAPGSRRTRTIVIVTVVALFVLVFAGVFMFG